MTLVDILLLNRRTFSTWISNFRARQVHSFYRRMDARYEGKDQIYNTTKKPTRIISKFGCSTEKFSTRSRRKSPRAMKLTWKPTYSSCNFIFLADHFHLLGLEFVSISFTLKRSRTYTHIHTNCCLYVFCFSCTIAELKTLVFRPSLSHRHGNKLTNVKLLNTHQGLFTTG